MSLLYILGNCLDVGRGGGNADCCGRGGFFRFFSNINEQAELCAAAMEGVGALSRRAGSLS